MSDSNGDSTLNVSAWHLQVLLTSLSSFDGKMMFLSALNVAGISALIGIALTADPMDWLFALSLSVSSFNVLLGLGRLWVSDSSQFPTPQAMRHTLQVIKSEGAERQEYLNAIWQASHQAQSKVQRLVLLLRLLLIMTSVSLGTTIANAVFAVY